MIKKFITINLLLFTVHLLYAQNMGSIKGRITDFTTGKTLVGVNIISEKIQIGVISNNKGEYHIDNVKTGTYEFFFSIIGYQTISKHIKIKSGETVTVNIKLKEKTENIDEVLVTAKSEARKIREQAMPISVIAMDEIQGTVSDINEVLAKTAGVKLRNTGGVGSSSRISVRGLEGKRIGYFIDDTPMNDNSDFMDLNDIPIDLIERIEIYKGVVPAKFGGSAIGGAVNIVTKEYPPTYVDASYSIASFNTHKASTILKTNKNGYEFGIGGFYTYSDNDYEMELPLQKGKFVKRDHDNFKKYTIGGGFTSKNWWFDEVVFEPVFTHTERQIQGIEHNIQEAESSANAYLLSSKIEKENFFIEGLDFEFHLAYAYTIFKFKDKAMKRYNWDGTTYAPVTVHGGEIGVQPSDADNIKHVVISKLNLNYILNKWSSLNLNSTLNFARGIPKDILKDKVIGHKTNYNSIMFSWVTGLNYETRFFNDKLTNSITAKYYQYSMKTKLVDIYGVQNVEDIDMFKTDFGISNAIRYRFTPEFLIKASAAYDVRLPAENELLGDGFIIAPAGNLEPERNTSFNIGLMYDVNFTKNRRFQVEINGFYMQLENMIRFTGGPLQSIYQNFGEMRTLGADMEIKWDATNFLYLYGNATYQDLRDTRKHEPGSTVENPTKGDRIPNIPYFFANAGFEMHKENLFGGTEQNSRFFASASFVEEYFYDFEQSIYQERRIPRALTFDAGIEHSFRNQSIIIGFQANNITDQKVISEFNRPLPGRNFALKLRYILK